jgi:hypothetical protein
MELPITWEAIRHTTDAMQKQREQDLKTAVHADIDDPKVILQQFERDLRESINKNEKKIHFTYILATYPHIYSRFGKEDVDKAILEMANNYIRNHFPIATATIQDHDGRTCYLIIHFTLPWLSGQTNSR